MKRAIFPGSFDPLTKGHLDIIQRSVPLFDEMIVAVNTDTGDCRMAVESFQGLLVDYAKQREAAAIVRGIRAVSDYDYEVRMALMNRRLEPEIETVFLMAAEEYSYVSSRLLKQVFRLGGRVDGLVPALVEKRMREKLNK